MNILFLLKHYAIGGVEVVTQVLANKFNNEGHKVFIVAFEQPPLILVQQLNENIETLILDLPIYSKANVSKLHNIIANNAINIIINQWGLPFEPTRLVTAAKKGTNAKYISVQHNTPNVNERIINAERAVKQATNFLKKIVLELKSRTISWLTSQSMKYVHSQSDKYILLSARFIPIFRKFTGIKEENKLRIITNPITINNEHFVYNPTDKIKEIIYVGRVDYNQKRVHRVIETWALLEKDNPDWKLTIVGDGVSKADLESYVIRENIKNVYFEGFKNPVDYYKRASFLVLTSEYEGFPLVLPECMSFGVVPIAYGSYEAVYDMIDDGENGIIITKGEWGFIPEEMAKQLIKIMNNGSKLNMMACSAISKSEKFSVNDIYSSWMSLFHELTQTI